MLLCLWWTFERNCCFAKTHQVAQSTCWHSTIELVFMTVVSSTSRDPLASDILGQVSCVESFRLHPKTTQDESWFSLPNQNLVETPPNFEKAQNDEGFLGCFEISTTLPTENLDTRVGSGQLQPRLVLACNNVVRSGREQKYSVREGTLIWRYAHFVYQISHMPLRYARWIQSNCISNGARQLAALQSMCSVILFQNVTNLTSLKNKRYDLISGTQRVRQVSRNLNHFLAQYDRFFEKYRVVDISWKDR